LAWPTCSSVSFSSSSNVRAVCELVVVVPFFDREDPVL
jgi:hypothetical protein